MVIVRIIHFHKFCQVVQSMSSNCRRVVFVACLHENKSVLVHDSTTMSIQTILERNIMISSYFEFQSTTVFFAIEVGYRFLASSFEASNRWNVKPFVVGNGISFEHEEVEMLCLPCRWGLPPHRDRQASKQQHVDKGCGSLMITVAAS